MKPLFFSGDFYKCRRAGLHHRRVVEILESVVHWMHWVVETTTVAEGSPGSAGCGSHAAGPGFLLVQGELPSYTLDMGCPSYRVSCSSLSRLYRMYEDKPESWVP